VYVPAACGSAICVLVPSAVATALFRTSVSSPGLLYRLPYGVSANAALSLYTLSLFVLYVRDPSACLPCPPAAEDNSVTSPTGASQQPLIAVSAVDGGASVRFNEHLSLRGISITPTMLLVFEVYLSKQVTRSG
jgi:hypothetical protein